jgi:hypothetical protein
MTGKTRKKSKIRLKSKNKKEAQLVIRLDEKMRDQFVAACKDMDTSASREIRRFIKRFQLKYENGDFEE